MSPRSHVFHLFPATSFFSSLSPEKVARSIVSLATRWLKSDYLPAWAGFKWRWATDDLYVLTSAHIGFPCGEPFILMRTCYKLHLSSSRPMRCSSFPLCMQVAAAVCCPSHPDPAWHISISASKRSVAEGVCTSVLECSRVPLISHYPLFITPPAGSNSIYSTARPASQPLFCGLQEKVYEWRIPDFQGVERKWGL